MKSQNPSLRLIRSLCFGNAACANVEKDSVFVVIASEDTSRAGSTLNGACNAPTAEANAPSTKEVAVLIVREGKRRCEGKLLRAIYPQWHT